MAEIKRRVNKVSEALAGFKMEIREKQLPGKTMDSHTSANP